MRGIIPYLLLILFMLQVFAFSPVLLWMKNEIRCEMKEGLVFMERESELLSFSENEYKAIQWIDDSEFMMNGHMYDLIGTERTIDGMYILKVVSDQKETKTMEMLEDDHDARPSASKNIRILIPFFSLYLGAVSPFAFIAGEHEIKSTFVYLVSFPFPDRNKTSPPPRLT